jgi:magnesium transporter
MSRRRKKRFVPTGTRIRPGAAPCTLSIPEGSPAPVLHAIAYGPEKLDERMISDLDEIPRVKGSHPTLWLNVVGLGDATVLQKIAAAYDMHRLALGDVVNVGQRAKVEDYGDRLFVVTQGVSQEDSGHRRQTSILVGEGFVLTFVEGPEDPFEPIRERLREGLGRPIRESGADYLAYAIVDTVIDGYFPVLDQLADRLDAMEQEVFFRPETATPSRILEIKNELRELRRLAWPNRELAGALLRPGLPRITDSTRVYLRDCVDHSSQVIDLLDSYREGVSDLTHAYLSAVSNRMNEVMKVLTIMATIFIPLTFIAGIYGMNFEYMPELKWHWAYPALWILLLAIAVFMIFWFKKKKWL